MLLFGHIGITLASAALASGLTDKLRSGIIKNRGEEASPTRGSYSSTNHPDSKTSFFRSLANCMDIRFLLVGSMLPDIIDKPIGIYLFRETFSNGRIFTHTLLFLVLVTVVGLILKRSSGKTWGLALSIGTLLHLILDQMWQAPKTLLWPVFGIAFERMDPTYWLGNIFSALLRNPEVYVPEIIGVVVFVWFVWELLYHKAVMGFLKKGSV